MLNIPEFLRVTIPIDDPAWLEAAPTATDYVLRNAASSDIILHTGVGQTFIHAVLAKLDKVSPPDGRDLLQCHAGADSSWAIEYASGGGQPDAIYLSPPLDHRGCNSLVGGEQLVFRRFFRGVDKGSVRTEISQSLVHALDLYWLDEQSAYCRLDEEGDIKPIIRVLNMSKYTGKATDILVTINSHQLHRYMTVTETALIIKFDFTRYKSGSFAGWESPRRTDYAEGDLFYHTGVQANSGFASGVYIVRPRLTKADMIAVSRREREQEGKQYARFKAYDWKNGQQSEISCAPTALASYFEKDFQLPFQVTPAFFKPEVLQKYKADPEKYTMEHRAVHSRAGWELKTYDVNEAGQVHTYLCYLANLPYSEQLYWQSFNEWPKGPISQRAYETDIEGRFSTIDDPLLDLKGAINKLDTAKPDW